MLSPKRLGSGASRPQRVQGGVLAFLQSLRRSIDPLRRVVLQSRSAGLTDDPAERGRDGSLAGSAASWTAARRRSRRVPSICAQANAASPTASRRRQSGVEGSVASPAFRRRAGIRLIVFRILLGATARAGRLQLLPADSFDGFEWPQVFFDDLHLNRAGRQGFSVALAHSLLVGPVDGAVGSMSLNSLAFLGVLCRGRARRLRNARVLVSEGLPRVEMWDVSPRSQRL